MRYIKMCPRCGHWNDELAEACARDGEFLGLISAVPEPVTPNAAPEQDPLAGTLPASPAPAVEPAPEETVLLYLDVPETGACYEVRNGWTAGQAHPTNAAEVQLENLAGLEFVHRAHCRFERREGRWYVTPLPQPSYTNPTLLNQRRLTPGVQVPLNNGDRLTLANILLHVRIIEW